LLQSIIFDSLRIESAKFFTFNDGLHSTQPKGSQIQNVQG